MEGNVVVEREAPTGELSKTGQSAPAFENAVTGRRLAVIMISTLLGLFLAALDQTVVGPALPRIIGDLNGFDYYAWVVTIYLLTSTIAVPIAGKLSDMYGRKWFYIGGVVIFLVGSFLSGLSADIWQLIVFRGIQGIGAGVLFASAFAIVADLIPPADRGKWQGAFGAVFGIASVVGPTIGGFLTDNINWRWVFYVNVPIGIVAIVALVAFFPSNIGRNAVARVRDIDWAGAFTLTAGLVPLLVALSFGGTEGWEWASPLVIGMFAAAVIFLALFVWVESRAKEAIIPLDLFRNSIFSVSMIVVFLTGVGLFGAILYIPLFIQAIQGDSATNSGNAVTPMTLAIVLSSIITGQIVARTGKYRLITIGGMFLVTVGAVLLYSMNMQTERLATVLYMVVMGLGLGVAFPIFTLIVQNAFPIQRVGVVTAGVQFFRSIGATVGVAILGSVVTSQFRDNFGPELQANISQLPPQAASNIPVDQLVAGLSKVDPQALVSAEGVTRLREQLGGFGVPAGFIDQLMGLITDAMKPALFAGIQQAFFIAAVLLGLGLVFTLFLKEVPLRKTNMRQAPGEQESEIRGQEPGNDKGAEEAGKQMAAGGLPGATNIPAADQPRLARE